VFLSNNHSQTTTVGAGGVRVIFWVQPWAPAGCGQTTAAMVVRRVQYSLLNDEALKDYAALAVLEPYIYQHPQTGEPTISPDRH
jgi:hypothetical protein